MLIEDNQEQLVNIEREVEEAKTQLDKVAGNAPHTHTHTHAHTILHSTHARPFGPQAEAVVLDMYTQLGLPHQAALHAAQIDIATVGSWCFGRIDALCIASWQFSAVRFVTYIGSYFALAPCLSSLANHTQAKSTPTSKLEHIAAIYRSHQQHMQKLELLRA